MTDFLDFIQPKLPMIFVIFWATVFFSRAVFAEAKVRKQALRADFAEQKNGDLVHRIFDLHDSIRSLVADRDRLLAAVESFVQKYGPHLNECTDKLGETAEACRENVGREGCPCCRGYDRDEDRPVLYRKATDPLCHRCSQAAAVDKARRERNQMLASQLNTFRLDHREEVKWNF